MRIGSRLQELMLRPSGLSPYLQRAHAGRTQTHHSTPAVRHSPCLRTTRASRPGRVMANGNLIMSRIRITSFLATIYLSVLQCGCAPLGVGPLLGESRSDLLTQQVVLNRFRENSLSEQDPQLRIIRVTWMPTFESPFLIRLDSDGKMASCTTKQLSGMGGYAPGHLTQKRIQKITPTTFDQYFAQLDKYEFWNAPTKDPNEMTSLDGPEIIVEVLDKGRFHQITRYSPGDHPQEKLLENFLLKVSDYYQPRNILRPPFIQ